MTEAAAVLSDIWSRATTAQPVPEPAMLLLWAVVALVFVGMPQGYRLVRHLVTLLHEAGHAAVALLTGRRLRGIRLHSDTSGVTLSRGRASGPGLVATLAAGYPTPALVAWGAAALLAGGYAVGVLWALVLLCLLMMVQVRNLYGAMVLLLVGGAVGAAGWWLPEVVLGHLATVLVWTLLVAAPRSVVELARAHRSGRGATSDAGQLARVTGVPAAVWLAIFWMVTVGPLLAGGWLLLGRSG